MKYPEKALYFRESYFSCSTIPFMHEESISQCLRDLGQLASFCGQKMKIHTQIYPKLVQNSSPAEGSFKDIFEKEVMKSAISFQLLQFGGNIF